MKKQANEQEIKNALNELEKLLESVGWSKNTLAEKIASANEGNSKSEYERIKKMFNRLPKRLDKITDCIQFVINHREHKKHRFSKLPELIDFTTEEKQFLKDISEISAKFFDEHKK